MGRRGKKVKKSHPNSGRLNNLIQTKLAECSSTLIDLQTQKNDTSSKAIKRTIKGNSPATFFAQADSYIENLRKSGMYNRLSAEEPRINRFKEFLNHTDITFKEITVPLLNKYKAHLKETRKISDRTVINHLVVIRSIFNQAIKGQLVDRKYYPFGSEGIQIKFPDSIKMGLIQDEIEKLENIKLPNPKEHHARNIWLFSFYFAGMRVSDVLRLTWSEIHNDRLYYAIGKNGKVGSLKVTEKAKKILEQYIADKDETDLVFPELKSLENLDDIFHTQMRIKTKVKAINQALREVKKKSKIEKPLTMHIPRHSFGNISGDRIPVQMLQKTVPPYGYKDDNRLSGKLYSQRCR